MKEVDLGFPGNPTLTPQLLPRGLWVSLKASLGFRGSNWPAPKKRDRAGDKNNNRHSHLRLVCNLVTHPCLPKAKR